MVIASAVMIAGAALLPALPVQAASSAALSIVPKKNYMVEQGKTIRDTLVIRNLDRESALELSLRVVDFTFTDDGGTPQLMLAEDAPQTTWSLKPFLTLPTKTVSVAPGGSQTVDMNVSIPANQGAGSYYSAIVYSSGDPTDGGNVGLSASGVTLAFVSVPGEVNEKLTLEKFGAYQAASDGKKAGYTWLATSMPHMMAYTLKNEGNVFESPAGTITLKNIFGKETIINDVNPNSSLALIGQSRTFTTCMKTKEQDVDFNGSRSEATTCSSPKLWPGLYTAKLNLLYGQNGNLTRDVTGSAFFWYLPWWFIAIVILVLALIAYFTWRIVRFFRQKFGHSVKLSKR